jgi:hypothetical protein
VTVTVGRGYEPWVAMLLAVMVPPDLVPTAVAV